MLDDKTRELAGTGKNFAVMSTAMTDGSIQSHTMWCDLAGDLIRINTEIHRAKFKNVERDARVTLLIQDATNPWNYSEVRGKVVEIVRGPEARTHIDTLAKKYLDVDDYPNPIQTERVMLKIAADRTFNFPPGT